MSGKRPSAAPAKDPSADNAAPEFYCAEIWGGNRPIAAPFDLPGVFGRVVSLPAEGGRGGDIHYISLCSSGLISRMCLADVAGHGESVARVSGHIHTLLRRYMNRFDQRRVLRALNEQIVAEDVANFTTAAAVTYVPPFKRLSVSYAGHPPGWYYTASARQWERLWPASWSRRDKQLIDLPLGTESATHFSRRQLRPEPGDRLLLVTDGVIETPVDGNGPELFGDERVAAVLQQHVTEDVDGLTNALLEALRSTAPNDQLGHDDVTFMLMEFRAGPKGWGIWHGLKRRLFPNRGRRTGRADSTQAGSVMTSTEGSPEGG
jgi:sigma-B regulation protein RsbU (phosphoserine phosphatase)